MQAFPIPSTIQHTPAKIPNQYLSLTNPRKPNEIMAIASSRSPVIIISLRGKWFISFPIIGEEIVFVKE